MPAPLALPPAGGTTVTFGQWGIPAPPPPGPLVLWKPIPPQSNTLPLPPQDVGKIPGAPDWYPKPHPWQDPIKLAAEASADFLIDAGLATGYLLDPARFSRALSARARAKYPPGDRRPISPPVPISIFNLLTDPTNQVAQGQLAPSTIYFLEGTVAGRNASNPYPGDNFERSFSIQINGSQFDFVEVRVINSFRLFNFQGYCTDAEDKWAQCYLRDRSSGSWTGWYSLDRGIVFCRTIHNNVETYPFELRNLRLRQQNGATTPLSATPQTPNAQPKYNPQTRPTPVAPTRPAAPTYPTNPLNPANPTVPAPAIPTVRPNAAGIPEPVLDRQPVDRPTPWPNSAPTPDNPTPQPIPIAPYDPENPNTPYDSSNPAPTPLTPETQGTSRDRPPQPRGTNAPAPGAAPAPTPNYQFQPTDPAAPPANQDTQSQSICRFFPIPLDPVIALLNQIIEMLQRSAAPSPPQQIETEQIALPYVVEQGEERMLQQQFFQVIAGSFPYGAIANFNQTAQWALIKPDEYAKKAYELLGGGTLFNDAGRATLNPETTIRQEIDRIAPDGENVNTVQVLGIAGLITSLVAAMGFRQGLHTFPRTIETLEDDLVSPATSIAKNTVDVTMVSNRQGMAIMKGLKAAQEFLTKVSQRLHFDRVTNMLTFITTLHNAMMLSRNIAESLGFLIDESLKVVGWQPKDENGNQIPISELLGNSVRGFIISLIGEEAFNGAMTNWHNLNRIITSAANIVWSFQSIGFSILQALETIGEMNAKVANALRKYGVVFERAYGWFNPTPNFQNRWFTRLEQVENLVDNLSTIVGEVRNIQETVDQLDQQRDEFLEAWEQGIRDAFPEHQPAKTQAQESKDTSQSPPIDPVDLIKPEGE